MITTELLNQDAVLKELSDEQKAALVTLSENDEKTTFNAKFSEMLNGYDEMVKAATGKGKNTNEKTSDYINRTITEFVGQVKSLTEAKDGQEQTIKQLQEQIANGSADKTLLAQKEATISDLQTKYAALKEEAKKAKADYNQNLLSYRINAEIGGAVNGFAIKEGVAAEAVAALKRQAVADVLGKNPSYETLADGREVLIFHDADGKELRNPENQLNPYTASELLKESLAKYGILDEESHGGGAGGGGSKPKHNTLPSGIKTKTQFTESVYSELAELGLARGTEAFNKAFAEKIEANKDFYESLPLY